MTIHFYNTLNGFHDRGIEYYGFFFLPYIGYRTSGSFIIQIMFFALELRWVDIEKQVKTPYIDFTFTPYLGIVNNCINLGWLEVHLAIGKKK